MAASIEATVKVISNIAAKADISFGNSLCTAFVVIELGEGGYIPFMFEFIVDPVII